VWSFLVLLGSNLFNESSLTVQQLGKLICRIESSLHRWESGFCQGNESVASPTATSTVRKPRLRIGRQYFRIPEIKIFQPDPQQRVHLDFPSEESRLPHLRDLPIAPQTLCKLASACQKSFANGMGFSDTFTRIALRLYTSSSIGDKIMSGSSVMDLSRLLEAAASSERSSGREVRLSNVFIVFLLIISTSL
jgi:hypothetical protein